MRRSAGGAGRTRSTASSGVPRRRRPRRGTSPGAHADGAHAAWRPPCPSPPGGGATDSRTRPRLSARRPAAGGRRAPPGDQWLARLPGRGGRQSRPFGGDLPVRCEPRRANRGHRGCLGRPPGSRTWDCGRGSPVGPRIRARTGTGQGTGTRSRTLADVRAAPRRIARSPCGKRAAAQPGGHLRRASANGPPKPP